MSPHDSGENDDEHLTISSKDYLKVMLQRYELDNSDIGFVKKQMSLDLIESIYNTNTTKNPIKFNKMEKLFDKRLVAILKNLMAFNPEKRPDASEVLKDSLFDSMRVSHEERSFEKVELMTDFENYDLNINEWRINCLQKSETLVETYLNKLINLT